MVAERETANTNNSWSLEVMAECFVPIGALSSISPSINSTRSYLVNTPAATII
jgi:hypothetical protein